MSTPTTDPTTETERASAQLPKRRASRWATQHHPRLTRYRPNQRDRIKDLLEYAAEFCVPGVITDTDALVAHAVGLGLEQFHELMALMDARQDARAVTVGGRRQYEFCPALEPAYQDDPRCCNDLWDIAVPIQADVSPLPHPFAVAAPQEGEKRRGNNQKWELEVSGPEKTAFSRDCARVTAYYEQRGQAVPRINRDKWLVWYQGKKHGEMFPADGNVTFERGETAASKSYKGEGSESYASRDVDDTVAFHSSRTEEKQQQQQEATARAESDIPKVTDPKVTFSAVASLSEEQRQVYKYLLSQGVWKDVAGPAALWLPAADKECYVWWVRSILPPDVKFGNSIAFHLKEEHPLPEDARQAYAAHLKKERQAQTKREQAQAQQKQQQAEQAQVDAHWQELPEPERETLLYQAANRLVGSILRDRWKEFLVHRARNSEVALPMQLAGSLHRNLDELLRERLKLVPLDKEQQAPPRFVMPPQWDGKLTETGGVPIDLASSIPTF